MIRRSVFSFFLYHFCDYDDSSVSSNVDLGAVNQDFFFESEMVACVFFVLFCNIISLPSLVVMNNA